MPGRNSTEKRLFFCVADDLTVTREVSFFFMVDAKIPKGWPKTQAPYGYLYLSNQDNWEAYFFRNVQQYIGAELADDVDNDSLREILTSLHEDTIVLIRQDTFEERVQPLCELLGIVVVTHYFPGRLQTHYTQKHQREIRSR